MQENNDPSAVHFELLCNMVDMLKEDLNNLNYRRDTCDKCERPQVVCLCDFLPQLISIEKNIKIWIFQHPFEEKRCLRTTRILEKCLSEKNFKILKGKRFTIERYPQLKQVYENPNTVVLYPSETAISLNDYTQIIEKTSNQKNLNNTLAHHNSNETTKNSSKFDQLDTFNVIVVDGTWSQASGIYYTNLDLQNLKQIKIDCEFTSAYTVRTQPREFYLSTLETVAIIVSTIEQKPNIYDDLVKPLKALCDYQFEHGAKPHQSKEYLIFNGLYKKPISKKNLNKLTKDSKFLKNDIVYLNQEETVES